MLHMDAAERRREAARIRGRREALGWSQQDLADYARVSLGTVGNYETGAVATPQTGKLERLLAALNFGEDEASANYISALATEGSLPSQVQHEVEWSQLNLLASMAELRIRQRPDLTGEYVQILVDISDRARLDEGMFRIASLGFPRSALQDKVEDVRPEWQQYIEDERGDSDWWFSIQEIAERARLSLAADDNIGGLTIEEEQESGQG